MSTVDVHAVVEGPTAGPVVVFSNSLGATLGMWDAPAAALRDRFRVVRYDTRGHGASPVPPGPYDIADLGADVVRLLDRLGVDRVAFVGLSLGGMTGMWLAANFPERVDRLVLCCTSAQLGPAAGWRDRAATVRAEGSAAVAGAVVGRWLTPAFAAAHPGTVAQLQAMIAATPAEGYAACCGAIARMDLRGVLDRITAPTLVIAGEQDPATPPQHAHTIVSAVAGSRLAMLSPAAHLATAEQPDRMTQLIAEHLGAARSGP